MHENNGSEVTMSTASSLKQKSGERPFYKADDTPPTMLTFFFGLQQVMVSVSVLVSIPFLISDEVCPGQDLNSLRVRLISGTFVVCGLATIVQTSLGMRLALLQGVAFAYIPSIRAFMSLPEFKCNATANDYVPPEEYESKMALFRNSIDHNSCDFFFKMTEKNHRNLFTSVNEAVAKAPHNIGRRILKR
uniref:Uncharacterized protein n=1 Tax=Ditylenchus dipsaci TaxID=166011 RepID=A0A915CZP6_9BILA